MNFEFEAKSIKIEYKKGDSEHETVTQEFG